MSLLNTVYISIMAICLGLGIVNLIIWLNQRKKIHFLFFFVTAIAAGAMALMDGISIRITDPEKSLTISKYYHIPVYILLVSMVWFIKIYFQTGRKW